MRQTYPLYEQAVLQELQDSMTNEMYERHIADRMSIIEVVIMDEYDRPGKDRPSVEQVVEQIKREFITKA